MAQYTAHLVFMGKRNQYLKYLKKNTFETFYFIEIFDICITNDFKKAIYHN